MALAAVVVAICVGLSPQLFAVAQDQEFARVAGLNVRFYNLLVAVLAAVSVTVAMRTVGLLLVSALMVVPVATSQQLTRSFRTTLVAAMGLGTLASVGGLVLSAFASFHADGSHRADDRAAGPGRLRGRLAGWAPCCAARRRVRAPFPRAGARLARGHRRAPPRARDGLRPRRGRRTATTSTTSTTATGTPPTGSTMTSTDPTPPPLPVPDRPGSARPSSRCWRPSPTSAPRRRSTSCSASAASRSGWPRSTGPSSGWPTPARSTCCAPRTARRSTAAAPTPITTTWSAAPAAPPSRSRDRPSSGGPGRSPTEHGYDDVSHTLEIFGTCPACR